MTAAGTLVAIGALLIGALVVERLGEHVHVPRVTLLLLLGVAAGPVGLDVLPPQHESWFSVLTTVALTMVGLLIGGDFTTERLRNFGREVGLLAGTQVVVVAVVVALGLLAVGIEAVVALPLAGIAGAAAPATLMALADEVELGDRKPMLLGTAVAVDTFTIVAFSLLVAVASIQAGADPIGSVGDAAWELGGAVILGMVLGVPAALLSGRLGDGRPLLEEAVGIVLLSAGLSVWLEVSYLLTAVTIGVVIANVAGHHDRTLRQIEGIEWPPLVLFFVLAGASMELDAVTSIGAAGVGYVVFRAVGKLVGASLAARWAGEDLRTGVDIGLTLLPQAGVALGLALLVQERLPEVGQEVTTVVVVTTVVFELTAPLLGRWGLQRMASPGPGG